MSDTDDRAAMLRRFLERGCKDSDDYFMRQAHSLGSAAAMLGHFLGLYGERSYPDSARRMFDEWCAEQPTPVAGTETVQ